MGSEEQRSQDVLGMLLQKDGNRGILGGLHYLYTFISVMKDANSRPSLSITEWDPRNALMAVWVDSGA